MLGRHPVAIRLVQDKGSAHWVVREGDGAYTILRRYRDGETAASVEWETTVLRHLEDRGWPVATPLTGPIEVGGRWWAAFRRLPGRRQEWDRNDPRHRWRGELLARLHRDLADIASGIGQRDGHHRADEAAEITPEHVALLARLRRLDRPRAVAMERHARQIAEGVSFLHAHRFPMTIVHGDFLPWNLHARGSTILGIFDFEASRHDTRASDVAWATWGGRYPDACEGYGAIAPLSEEEEAALPLLWRASWLTWAWTLVARSRDRVEPELDAVLEKLARPWGD
ncbi:MAG TPA: phosphotransferase [Acidimicrobiales bacterium]|jgi:Ser/Thr protein kinase RdoA (MazF antagonist)|nr:phosphotransferase [Acidimicrobiales bacterium]